MYQPKLPANVELLEWVGPTDLRYVESGLIHCTRVPNEATQTQPAPTVVMLHGWSGDEGSMWIFKRVLPKHVAIFAPRAPIVLANDGFVWFEEMKLQPTPVSMKIALEKLERFLASLPRLYPIDPTRLVLIGFSQGAFISNAFTMTHPYDVMGVVSLAGAMPKMPQVEYHPRLLAGLPVFIAHGIRDNAIPLSAAQQARDTYTELGADVAYGEYPVAHKMNPQAIKDLKIWLAKLFPEQR